LQIVVRAGGVVDAVASAARGASLKANQLRQQARVIEQIELARVDSGQQVAVQVGLWFLRGLISDANLAKSFARPLARP
jgi:hypothetical protein